ncbi:MAG: hypothetical protein ABL889_22395 [Terricaulis sp.]
MNYSICLLDSGGRTQHTHFGAFDNDGVALAQARSDLKTSSIVEVWKDELLLARLFQEAPAASAE